MEIAVMCFICLCTGWALCFITMRNGHVQVSASPDSTDPKEVMVKRVKPSLRSPLRTTKTAYDKYKANGSDLLSPVRPKGDKKDEVEVGR